MDAQPRAAQLGRATLQQAQAAAAAALCQLHRTAGTTGSQPGARGAELARHATLSGSGLPPALAARAERAVAAGSHCDCHCSRRGSSWPLAHLRPPPLAQHAPAVLRRDARICRYVETRWRGQAFVRKTYTKAFSIFWVIV
eukprot:9475308-Pyramimonas_sp.AAC.3